MLNILLRNALYTSYIRDAYGLGAAERWCEVPLDGVIARRVRSEMPGSALPRWRGVRHVTPELSREYQEVCRQLAMRRECAPVHLDAVFWGGRYGERARDAVRIRLLGGLRLKAPTRKEMMTV